MNFTRLTILFLSLYFHIYNDQNDQNDQNVSAKNWAKIFLEIYCQYAKYHMAGKNVGDM